MKGRGFEDPADVADQDVVRGGPDRPAPPARRRGRRRLPPRVDARAGALPHPADPLHAIRPTRGDRVGALHRLDLRRAKGPPASNWSTFAYSSSVSISSSPILACSRRLASSLASGARLFRLAWPAARNRSRHCAARAAVIPSSRDTDSRSSPRSRRSTVSRLRRADNRPPRPRPAASPVALRALPPPPPIPDLVSPSRHASCEYSLAIKCPRKPWGAGLWPFSKFKNFSRGFQQSSAGGATRSDCRVVTALTCTDAGPHSFQ